MNVKNFKVRFNGISPFDPTHLEGTVEISSYGYFDNGCKFYERQNEETKEYEVYSKPTEFEINGIIGFRRRGHMWESLFYDSFKPGKEPKGWFVMDYMTPERRMVEYIIDADFEEVSAWWEKVRARERLAKEIVYKHEELIQKEIEEKINAGVA